MPAAAAGPAAWAAGRAKGPGRGAACAGFLAAPPVERARVGGPGVSETHTHALWKALKAIQMEIYCFS